MVEIAWLIRQIIMFACYVYLHLLLVFVMTAICFPDTFLPNDQT